MEPAHFVMGRRQLLGLRQRAETTYAAQVDGTVRSVAHEPKPQGQESILTTTPHDAHVQGHGPGSSVPP